MEQQLAARLNQERKIARSKYGQIEFVNLDDPIRGHLNDEIERDLTLLRPSLTDDEIVQIQARIDELQPSVVQVLPRVVDRSKPAGDIFSEAQDEYYFLRRLLE